MTVPHAIAASSQVVVAQADPGGSEVEGEDAEGEGSGQSDPEAETGTEESESGAAEPETAPPWTFQMAWITLALSVLLGLAIARWYWKLVGSRQRTN
jgi:hypothetical protein